jgi:hypothetical protein
MLYLIARGAGLGVPDVVEALRAAIVAHDALHQPQ